MIELYFFSRDDKAEPPRPRRLIGTRKSEVVPRIGDFTWVDNAYWKVVKVIHRFDTAIHQYTEIELVHQ